MIAVERIESFAEFLKLEPQWNDWLAQSDTDIPFLTFEWLKCWWLSYSKDANLLIIIAKDTQGVVGIAPLMRTITRFRRVPVSSISFITNYHSNRAGFILLRRKEEAVFSLMQDLFSDKKKPDIMVFDFILSGSDTDIYLEHFLKKKCLPYCKKEASSSPYIPIAQSWEGFYKNLSSKFRCNLRRYEKRFKEKYLMQVCLETDKPLAETLDNVLSVSRKTWKFKTKTALASNIENMRFYSSLADIARTKNWLNIWLLYAAFEAVAFTYNLNYKNKTYVLKNGFCENFAAFAPSKLVSFFAIKHSFETEKTEYEWLGDKQEFKSEWTSLCKQHYKYWLFSQTAKGKLLFFAEKNIIPRIKRVLLILKVKNEY